MSLITSSMRPLPRPQLSPFPASFSFETNQQVPASPLSPFYGRLFRFPPHHSSPSSGSPLAQVPDSGSPLLRQLLASRKRPADHTPSPSPAAKRSRDSPRVPNSLVIVSRSKTRPKNRDDDHTQVVPTCRISYKPHDQKLGEGAENTYNETEEITSSTTTSTTTSYQRTLPEIAPNAKPLEIFNGWGGEIFAQREE